jgi:hypothetical protein
MEASMLRSSDRTLRLKALKALKNEIIGEHSRARCRDRKAPRWAARARTLCARSLRLRRERQRPCAPARSLAPGRCGDGAATGARDRRAAACRSTGALQPGPACIAQSQAPKRDARASRSAPRPRPRRPPAGSKSKKLQLLSLLPDVVALANRSDGDAEELIQSAATLGSFAYGVDDGVRAVVAQGAVQTLLRALGSGDEAVVEAAARSLKLIYRVRACLCVIVCLCVCVCVVCVCVCVLCVW